SVGYSTCHWCHVMAEGAFSHPDVADFLNRHFVSIKVDREERPDIDQYLMSFLVDTTGQGGWPLNAFLSPKQETFFAMTYSPAPDDPRAGTMMSFDAVLERVHEFYHQKKDQLGIYEPSRSAGAAPGAIAEHEKIDLVDVHPAGIDIAPIVDTIASAFDGEWGGFGGGPKFPPHSTLLWMLNARAAAIGHDTPATRGKAHAGPDNAEGGAAEDTAPENASATSAAQAQAGNDTADRLEDMLRLLLDTMSRRGLHDHLQGGFYRYCVDGRWTIPHFEKMLYDQAMLLWAYAGAAFSLDDPRYTSVAEGIVRCLNETFLESRHGSEGGLFVSAHDADTDHEEGATYLWTRQEIHEALTEEQWQAFAERFELPDGGNFEGKLHLVGDAGYRGPESDTTASALERLLEIRSRREQPFTDRKVVTSWNALAAIGLLVGGRLLGREAWIRQAESIAEELTERHDDGTSLVHASLDGEAGSRDFLEDYAALSLLYTYLAEDERPTGSSETGGAGRRQDGENAGVADGRDNPGDRGADTLSGSYWLSRAERLLERMKGFQKSDGGWNESVQTDFRAVSPSFFDQPVPSSISMADFALARFAMISHLRWETTEPEQALMRDFWNLSSLARSGLFHIIESPAQRDWTGVPLNSIWSPSDSQRFCFAGACRPGLPARRQ
ncbi:MAG: DUF255 domain-containing protein, partial [Spirochaetia bacterium]